jgi:chromosome partitioning protein
MKVISFAHDKGGVGKSTTIINVAPVLEKEFKLTVIDLDPKKQFTTFNNHRENKINMVSVSSINDLVEFISNSKDEVVLIDLGGFDSDFFRTALMISDIIIVPLSGSDNDIVGFADFENILLSVISEQKKNGIDIDCTILANRIHHNNKSDFEVLSNRAEELNFNIFNTIIRNSSVYSKMILSGKSATEQTLTTPGLNVLSLVEEIKEKIKG